MSFPIDFELPADRIAQEPCEPRDQARLLVLRRDTQTLEHRRVADLPDILTPGDLLILNDTRVVPARLVGRREQTGGKWEGLFLRQDQDGSWILLCQTRGRLQAGERIQIEPGPLTLLLEEKLLGGQWRVQPETDEQTPALLERHGRMPLPPYIRKGQASAADRTRYQTVFAREAGAVAAPTAGLHFTPLLLERLQERGVGRAFVTLHVGLGTFRPVEVDDYRRHVMHAEWGELPASTLTAITEARKRGGRIVAVGTTSARVLETVADRGELASWRGETSLYIYPPFQFKAVDAFLTNFHLPRSTLLLLTAAFAGSDLLRRAYDTAISDGYRFYSYGDAMLVL